MVLIFFLLFISATSIWTSFVSSCLFLAGNMLSPLFRFLLRLVQHMTCTRYVPWYVCMLISHFLFVWGTSIWFVKDCFRYCVCYLLILSVFFLGVIFRSRVIGACPVTTDCIVSMSWCRKTTTEKEKQKWQKKETKRRECRGRQSKSYEENTPDENLTKTKENTAGWKRHTVEKTYWYYIYPEHTAVHSLSVVPLHLVAVVYPVPSPGGDATGSKEK